MRSRKLGRRTKTAMVFIKTKAQLPCSCFDHTHTEFLATEDPREAVDGAGYVIMSIRVGGWAPRPHDIGIPLKYGIDQSVGDTIGPGGIFQGLRNAPALLAIADQMREVCPEALIIQHSNPMAINYWLMSLARPDIAHVGLCHSVQGTSKQLAGYLDVPHEELDYWVAGINHMAWFLRLEHNGRDLYPLLRQRFEKPEYYVNEKVRGEVFRQFGYLMTESSGHLSEYLPYFRKNQKALDTYCDEPEFGGESGAAFKWGLNVSETYAGRDMLANEPDTLPGRSIEYGSYIIEALETGRPFKFNGNVINGGMIANLPADCCAEGPVFADRTGLHRTLVGDLPPQCAALNLTNINVQRMATIAAREGDTEALVQACALDPLTAAVLTLSEIREMATAMLEAEREWLPQYESKEVRATPTISIPANVQRVHVPVDPALAIMERLGKLGSDSSQN